MDVDELYLDLLALRELYILLLKSCLRDTTSELLDERAQILLKHLLDVATSGVLKFVSKDWATNSNICYNFDKKVVEWMEHNQTARKMENSKIEHNNPIRDRASASNIAISDLSYGISSALSRIELHILSLQYCTSQSRKTRSHWQPVLKRNESLNQQKVLPRKDPSTLRSRFTKPIQGRGHLVGEQKVDPIMMNRCSEFVHGFRIPLSQGNDEAMMEEPSTIETHIPKQHKVANPMTLIDKAGCTSVGSKAIFKPAMKLNRSSKQVKMNQSSYGQVIMGPTLLDHHTSREAGKEQTHHNNTHLSPQQESESTNSEFESAFSSSSSWTTQQTTESETIDSDHDNDASSSPSHQDDPSTTDSKSTNSKSSSRYSTKTFNIKNGKKESKRAIGRFKLLKNKLGVIFHHHHHHCHHHHNSQNFMWKQLRKIFHHKENKRLVVSKEDGNEKVKNRAVRRVHDKNQVGKFQALAEGLKGHVWRSKAMKRKEFKGMKCGKKKKKNGVKKLHWWKMFRNRHGVKLPNKGRMKIGYVNRKSQL